jgi:hypothetical protein|tara:strand:- start:10643 stop:12871 length:2229 start_codon:yes stop_codon:yes gene_type:complete
MASTILIKRSTSTTVPSSLEFGELAVTVGAGTQVNRGDRVFVGDNNSTVQIIGGKYFTDMLDHVHGTLTADSAVITDSNSKLDRFRVDDVNIDANVVETDTTDTDLIFRANGTGKLVIEDGQELEFGTTGDVELLFTDADATLDIKRVGATVPDLRIQDDMRIYFGSDKDSGIRYDENQTDTLRVNGADWTYDNGVAIQFNDTTDATNASTGSVKLAGGLGVEKTAWIKDLVVDDNVTLGTANTDLLTVESTTTFNADVTFNGTQNVAGTINQTGQFNLDNIRLDGNTISTTAGSQIILDPDPTAGDSAGDLIVRGNLQVAGTTTTVNSTEMTVNDPVFNIGDTTSEKAVTAQAASAASTLNVDNPSGIATGGLVTGTNVGTGGRTITQIEVVFHTDAGFSASPSIGDAIYHLKDGVYQQLGTFQSQTASTVRVTLLPELSLRESAFYEGDSLTDGNTGSPQTIGLIKEANNQTVFETTTLSLSSGISAQIEIGDFVTVTQGSNDGMDRGIQYSYHNGSAIKHGFFGFDRTAGDDGLGAFTFIEDATNTNNIFTHVVGSIQSMKIEQDDLDYLSVTTLPGSANQTYTNLSPTGGAGSGLTVNVARDGSGAISIASVTIVTAGTYYQEGDLLTITGNQIGGSAGADDLQLRVTAVAISRGTVLLGDLELDVDLAVKFGGTGRSEFNSKGILYGNGAGELLETAAANMANPGVGPDVATSFQVLTVTAAGVPVWTDTIDGGTFT